MDDDVSGFDADHAADSLTQARQKDRLVLAVLSRLDHESAWRIARQDTVSRRTGTSPEATFRGSPSRRAG
jgi:hypothetical protein